MSRIRTDQRCHFLHSTIAAIALGIAALVGCGRNPIAEPSDPAEPSATETTAEAKNNAAPRGTVAAPPAPDEPPPRIPSTGKTLEQVTQLERLLNPESTGWQTESFNEDAGRQLKRLAHAIESSDRNVDDLRDLLHNDFHCVAFRPKDIVVTLQTPDLLTERSNDSPAGAPAERLAGPEGLLQAIRSLPQASRQKEDATDDFHVKFKIIRVELKDDIVETPVYVEGGGDSENGLVQWRANWTCQWQRDDELSSPLEETPPRLMSVKVDSYEQVTTPRRHQAWFADDTHAIFDKEPSYANQLAQGMDYWTARIEGRLGISRLGHHGLAIGDVNNDGWEDLYVCQPGGLPNRLYITQPDGSVRDVAAAAGVDYLDDSTCALLVDLDNDGDRDLVVVTVSAAVVLSNNGRTQFQPVAIIPECSNAFSLTAADYDGDRLPDLFVGRYWPSSVNRGEIAIPVPYYDAENGGKNMLLRNQGESSDGKWVFNNVTATTGLDDDNTRFTMAAAWEDVDNDGDPDLYIANDFGRNCLYRNDAGKFTNIAVDAAVEDIASGMSVSFADYDHNGHSDIYVSNMFSSAGNRVTYQRQYGERFTAPSLTKLKRMARGNSLFQNQGDGTFADTSLSAEVSMGRWAWGSIFTDVNNDGWEDLVVLNGFISTDASGDL